MLIHPQQQVSQGQQMRLTPKSTNSRNTSGGNNGKMKKGIAHSNKGDVVNVTIDIASTSPKIASGNHKLKKNQSEAALS